MPSGSGTRPRANTIRDAVKTLIAVGLVETRRGQGSYVTERFDPFITTLSADAATGLGGGVTHVVPARSR